MGEESKKLYTRQELQTLFAEGASTGEQAWLQSFLPEAVEVPPEIQNMDYLSPDIRAAVGNVGEQAVFYKVGGSGSIKIEVGFGVAYNPEDPRVSWDHFIHRGETELAINPIGTDHDRIEIFLHKKGEDQFDVFLTDVFSNSSSGGSYPQESQDEKEQIIGLVGEMMRRIATGQRFDMMVLKLQAKTFSPGFKGSPGEAAFVIAASALSPEVGAQIDKERAARGKLPFAESEIKDMDDLAAPDPDVN